MAALQGWEAAAGVASPDALWRDLGPGRGLRGRWACGGVVEVLDYEAGDYCGVRVRGEGCEAAGPEALADLLRRLASMRVRWRASRVDLAWDGVPFTVLDVDQAARAGHWNTRAFRRECVKSLCDGEGHRTVYLQGKQERSGPRLVRVYDRRGYVRIELECKQGYAAAICEALNDAPVTEWGRIALALLRETVEFVDVAGRVTRSKPLPWWAEFIGQSERGRLKPATKCRRSVLEREAGRIERQLKAAAKSVMILAAVMGPEWVVERARVLGESRWNAEDELLVGQLLKYVDSAGKLPDPAEHLPF